MNQTEAIPTVEQFLGAANGRARTRTFTAADYQEFMVAITQATEATIGHQEFYAASDAGGVANSYGYVASSARWGVWIDPVTHQVEWVVDRASCSGRHVSCPRKGGERQYHTDWEKAHLLVA